MGTPQNQILQETQALMGEWAQESITLKRAWFETWYYENNFKRSRFRLENVDLSWPITVTGSPAVIVATTAAVAHGGYGTPD